MVLVPHWLDQFALSLSNRAETHDILTVCMCPFQHYIKSTLCYFKQVKSFIHCHQLQIPFIMLCGAVLCIKDTYLLINAEFHISVLYGNHHWIILSAKNVHPSLLTSNTIYYVLWGSALYKRHATVL